MEEDLFARLSGDAAVAALVGTRIYPIRAPQAAALPRIVFARQEGENLGTLNGRGTHDRLQVLVECFAATVEQARARAAPTADPGVKRDALILLILAAET